MRNEKVFAKKRKVRRFLKVPNEAWWPPGTRKKSGYDMPGYEYEYDISKRKNRFGINQYFSRYGDRPFMKGKKRHMELLMLYNWCGKGKEYKEFLEDNPDL